MTYTVRTDPPGDVDLELLIDVGDARIRVQVPIGLIRESCAAALRRAADGVPLVACVPFTVAAEVG